jgi:hypothetical protein
MTIITEYIKALEVLKQINRNNKVNKVIIFII